MSRALLIILYRVFVAPLGVLLALTVGALFIPKVREGLRLRRVRRDWPTFTERPVWIHASSGEFEYAKPFITELKARQPKTPVVVTFFTPSFAAAIAKFPGVDFSLPLPIDLPGPTRGFLTKLNPQSGFIARTDLWPELLHQARKLGIPLTLFSVTKTKPPGLFARIYQRWLFGYMKSVYCVGDEDARLLKTTVKNINVEAIGDTRFDQVLQRLQNPKRVRDELKPEWRNTMVAGSTWSEDETVLFEALEGLLAAGKLKLVVVPHEPTPAHVEALVKEAEKRKLPHTVYSKGDQFNNGILIVDQIGILAELYRWGAFAFVGGSFKKSVHSVMEPLAAGSLTWIGPHHRNNREAIEFQKLNHKGQPFVQAVDNAKMMRESIEAALAKTGDDFASAVRAEIVKRGGASRRLVEATQGDKGFTAVK